MGLNKHHLSPYHTSLNYFFYQLASRICVYFHVCNLHSTDINTLLQRSRVTPFPQNKEVLTLNPVTPSDTILVSNLPPNTPDFATEIYFDKFAPIAHVKSISPTQALVTFKSHEGKKVDHTVHEYITHECKQLINGM